MRCAALALSLCICVGCDSDSPKARQDAAPAREPDASASVNDAATARAPDASASANDAATARDAAPARMPDASAPASEKDAMPSPSSPPRIVVFSRTAGYRHDAITAGQRALADIAARHGAAFAMTEDPLQLAAKLPQTDVVVFLMTTGDVLGNAEQAQLEAFIRQGGGYVGVHSAADTEYDWPFFETLNGAWFSDHPAIQPARIRRESAEHPATSFLPAVWERTDEWYNFRSNPRARVQVLLTLDEKSYEGGKMGDDHPIAWSHAVDRGRAFYTALGHTQESWKEPLFLQHIEQALLWAAGP